MQDFTAKYTQEQGKELLKLARQSIEDNFEDKKTKIPGGKEFRQERGVFVTLTKKNGDLRGCIGFPDPILPIGEAIVKASRAAAFSDPRFLPLTKEELENTKIEISLLTVPSNVEGEIQANFELGKDGLICERLGFFGLLLPQVAEEHHMDKIEFLETTCQKAGLPRDAWQNEKTRFKKFQVQSFEEG
jgi:uncharacterized protein (TIGR00296 family)